MEFNDILNKYIGLIKCTSKELAQKSNLSESIISRYRNASRIPNKETLKILSSSLSELSNNKYKKKDIFNEFNNVLNNSELNFDIIKNNLNILIDTFNISAKELSNYLNYDASYLSKIKTGNRIPSNKHEFINSLSNFIYKKYNNEKNYSTLKKLLNNDITIDNIKEWILTNKIDEEKETNNFLKVLDTFDLNDYIKSIKFDELKVPNIPFYIIKTKTYYGIEEMKKGELDFFKGTVLSKNHGDIFMCSDMPMEDMAKDLEFGKKWMFGIALSLKKGLHLNIIHNLDRPFNEMMLGLISWIPIYMTGQVSPYYFKDLKNTIYYHLNYVSSSCALTGECIKNNHNKGKYYLTNNKKELEYYKEKARLLLNKSNSLMDIYKEENINDYNAFLNKDNNIKKDRKRILSSLPLFTINDTLLIKILKRNNINEEDINKILEYKSIEFNNIKNILKTNTITDTIYNLNNDDFKKENIYLSLENIFYNKHIKYTYEEYINHYNDTINYSKNNKNYKIINNNNRTFKNINVTSVLNNYVIISKGNNPIIHFVIRHPKLIDAINNFNPLI